MGAPIAEALARVLTNFCLLVCDRRVEEVAHRSADTGPFGGAALLATRAQRVIRACTKLYFSERWGGQPSYPRGNDQLDATVRSTVSLQGGKSKRSFF